MCVVSAVAYRQLYSNIWLKLKTMRRLNVERSSTNMGFVFLCKIHFTHPDLCLYFEIFFFFSWTWVICLELN
jgi:hypothetical protein